MSRAIRILLVLAALSGVPLSGPAAAGDPEAPRGWWSFDRLTFSPGGDTLAFIAARHGSLPGRAEGACGDASPEVFLVDTAAGRVFAPPTAQAFQISPGGRAALLLGTTGLWWLDLASGSAEQIYFHPPGAPGQIYDFAFASDVSACLFLVGGAGAPERDLYRAAPGRSPERLAKTKPGAPPAPEWVAEARPMNPPPVLDVYGERRFGPSGGPELLYTGTTRGGRLEWAAGGAPTGIEGVEVAWADWPTGGGVMLVAVNPAGDSLHGRLLRFAPGRPVKVLMEAPTPQAGWVDSTLALVNDSCGRLYRYTAAADSLTLFRFRDWPEWTRRLAPPAEVSTLRIERWPRAAGSPREQQRLIEKCAHEIGDAAGDGIAYGVDGADVAFAGVYPSLSAAAAAAKVFERHDVCGHPTRSGAEALTGLFDFGETAGPAAGVRAFLRRPRRDDTATEIWVALQGQAPRRLLPAWEIP